MPALRKRDPVDAIKLPWPITLRVPGKRPKEFPAGTFVIRNRTNGDVYLLPESTVRSLYVADDEDAEKLLAEGGGC